MFTPKSGFKIEYKSDEISSSELLKIAHFVLNKVKGYAPVSSNTSIIEDDSEEQKIHRLLWINAMRARNDEAGIRQLIYSWNIDISNKIPDEKFESCWVKIKREQANIEELSQYLQDESNADNYHLEFNKESALIEVECTLLDLNNYVYDKIQPLDDKIKRKDDSIFSGKERMESITQRLVQWGIGNCSDMSQAALSLLMHYPPEGFPDYKLTGVHVSSLPIEILSFINVDHEFVVINRLKNSSLNNPETWGDKVIILDPWCGECYLLQEALSGAKKTLSLEYIMDKSARFNREDCGFIAEGPSEHWKAKHAPLEIFKLKTRALHPEERLPWIDPREPEIKIHLVNNP